MEREIKFRAWDKENKNMYGPFSIYGLCEALKELGDIEIMQFTGLKDKNEVEICEGDIVSWSWGGDGGTHMVEWANWSEEMSAGSGFQFPWFCVEDKSCKVIGNICEHSDLLKDEEQ